MIAASAIVSSNAAVLTKKERAGETRPFGFGRGSLGLAVPSASEASAMEAAGHAVTEAAGVGETYTMIEAVTHPMAETVVAAVRDIISTIGQIAVGEVGVAVVGTTVARVRH
jgi:hypothetical protein